MLRTLQIYALVRRGLSSRVFPVWMALLGVVMTLPSLGNDYARDDYLMRACFKGMPGLPEYKLGPLDTFKFFDGDPEQTKALVDRGLLPWWTAPELKVAFWRPLSSISHYLDLRLLGDHPVYMQLHSVLWYGLLCALAAVLFRRFIPVPWIAGLAALLYTIDDDHGIVVGWLCNRNGIITAALGVAVLLAHDAWRRGGKVWAASLAIVFFTIGLLTAEAGIGITAFLFSYALFLDPGKWRARMLVLVPYAAISVTYLLTYRTLGYGTLGSNWYLDPATSPMAFVVRLLVNLPLLTCTMAIIWPTWTWQFATPSDYPIFFAAILGLLAWFLYVFWPLLRRSSLACFWVVGSIISLAPSCAVVPHHRLTILASVGGMAVIALFLGGYWSNAEWVPRQRRVWRVNARIAVTLLIIAHVFLAAFQLPFYSMNMAVAGENTANADASIPSTADVADKTVILLHAPDDFFPWLFFVKRAAEERTMPGRLRLLNSASEMTVTREDERTILLRPENGFVPYTWHSPMRSSATPMRKGDVFALPGMTVTVVEVDHQGWPLAARFRFDVPLEDPSLLWLGLAHEQRLSVHLGRPIASPTYIPVQMPAIGETATMERIVESSPAFDRIRMESGSAAKKKRVKTKDDSKQ